MLEQLDAQDALLAEFYANGTLDWNFEKWKFIESRNLQSSFYIENPLLCVTEGESVTFPVDSSGLSYPVYYKESLLNSNLGFDYSEFLQLETSIL